MRWGTSRILERRSQRRTHALNQAVRSLPLSTREAMLAAAEAEELIAGAYTDGHGIGSNEWWDLSRNTDRVISSVEDERYRIVGNFEDLPALLPPPAPKPDDPLRSQQSRWTRLLLLKPTPRHEPIRSSLVPPKTVESRIALL